jgi:alkylation response protein AidB-like acyl-CoA dehydrogenase
MSHETMLARAQEVADRILAPAARANDKDGRFAIGALSEAGLLGLTLPAELGGSALGPRTFVGVTAAIACADASVAMIFLMHSLAAATIAAAKPREQFKDVLTEIAAGRHLSTLAFSEAGSRSHFWAPVSRARGNGHGVYLTAKKSWVTSAGYPQSYVVSALSPCGHGRYRHHAVSAAGRGIRPFGGRAVGRDGPAGQRLRTDAAGGLRHFVGRPANRGWVRIPGHDGGGSFPASLWGPRPWRSTCVAPRSPR